MSESTFTPAEELEYCIAGCILIEAGSNIAHVNIEAEDFTLIVPRVVIASAKELGRVDPVICANWAKKRGIKVRVSDIAYAINVVPTSTHLLQYVIQLKVSIYERKIHELRNSVKINAESQDLFELAQAMQDQSDMLKHKYLEDLDVSSLTASSSILLGKIESRAKNEDLVPTNISFLDGMLGGGLLPNELFIIAARPSVGKTALALQIALECNLKVCFISLEMSTDQIAPRLLSAITLMNTKQAARQPHKLDDEAQQFFLQASDRLLEVSERIIVNDKHDQSIAGIRRFARKQVDEGCKIIILDYLQLLDVKADSRERAVGIISRELKNMSKELNVPVICLAQMNRGIESEKRLPRLSDLRESGSIEQDANAVLFLYRPPDSGKANDVIRQISFILAKGRDIGENYRKGYFNTNHQRFYPLSD